MAFEIPNVVCTGFERKISKMDFARALVSKTGNSLGLGISVKDEVSRLCERHGTKPSLGDVANSIFGPAIIPANCAYTEDIVTSLARIMAYDVITEHGKGEELFNSFDVSSNGERAVVAAMMNEESISDNNYLYPGTETPITPEDYLLSARPSNGGYVLAEACEASQFTAIAYDAIMRRWADICKLNHDYSKRKNGTNRWKGNYCTIKALQTNPDPTLDDIRNEIPGICDEINIQIRALNEIIAGNEVDLTEIQSSNLITADEFNALEAIQRARTSIGSISDNDMIMYEMLKKSIDVAPLFMML